MPDISTLRTLYRQGRLIPFVGAGVSMSVKWNSGRSSGPSWADLVDEAARRLGFENPELLRARGTDLQILEYFKLINSGGGQPLTIWMAQHMNAPDDALRDSKIHEALFELKRCRTIYTTNFDDFLERSFQIRGETPSVVASEKEIQFTGDGREIVKFHGDWNHPDMMVLSETDYQDRLTFTTPMDFRLRSDMLNRALLFIGYSFRDSNVAYLFHLFKDQLPTLSARAFIVTTEPSDFEKRLFKSRGIEVLPVNSVTQTDDVVNLLNEIRGA